MAGVGASVEEEGALCRGGGGGRECAGAEGLCSTDWVRLCWACDGVGGRGEDALWGEERLSREPRPPEVGSDTPN